MSLSDYQQKVDAWVGQYKEGYWTPHEILARITEETGELARLINHVYGPKKKKDTEAEQEMGQEMVDIIYAIACLANRLNINLDDEFDKMMHKLNTRDADRFEKKSSSS